MNIVLLFSLFIFLFCSYVLDNSDNAAGRCLSLLASEIMSSLLSDDHCSEGLLLTMLNGKIWHFFRIGPGVKGGHIGIGGAICKKFSENNAETWSTPELLYDDSNFDDRNIACGITDKGDIILFFRQFGNISGYGGKTEDKLMPMFFR